MQWSVSVVAAASSMLATAMPAMAGDGNPPPWRGLPLSTTQGWNFVNGAQQGQAPNPAVVPINNPYSNPPFAPSPRIAVVSGATPTPDGGLLIERGSFISFLIPNNIDPDTQKEIWVQLRFAGSTPTVRTQGYDASGAPVTPIITGSVVAGPSPSPIPGIFEMTFLMHLPVNPAGELIVIDNFNVAPLILYQVVIDTICPTPGTAAAGLIGISLFASRRRR